MTEVEAIKVHKAMRSLGIMKAIYVHHNNDQYRYTYLERFKFTLNSIIPEPRQETVFEYNRPLLNYKERNMDIVRKWLNGSSQADLAREYDLSATTIHSKVRQFRNRFRFSDKWQAFYLSKGLNLNHRKIDHT